MSQVPSLKVEMEALRDYLKDVRKLTVPEAIVLMLNEIAYLLGMDDQKEQGKIRFDVSPLPPRYTQ